MQKMIQISFDVTKENIKKHNLNWPQIPEHPYRILIVTVTESNASFNLISHQPNIYKIYLYTKDPYQINY